MVSHIRIASNIEPYAAALAWTELVEANPDYAIVYKATIDNVEATP